MAQENNLNNDRLMPSFNAVMFDDVAFEKFFRKHFTPLCAYCQYKFGFDLELAKDTVHTGFSRLWENRQTISPELSIKAYLYKIVTNLSLDILKRDKVKRKHVKYLLDHSEESTGYNIYNDVDYKQLSASIEKAVSEMPEQMRKVFELCRYKELKCAETAELLGISVKTVETQMSRALVKLRQKLSYYLISGFVLLMLFKW